MRDLFRVVFVAGVGVLLLCAEPCSAQGVADPVPAVTSARLPPEFAGRWDYNAAESINVVTGRPEQAPRSATQRGGTTRGGGATPTGRGGGAGGGGLGGRGGGNQVSGVGPTPEMMREARDMSRDLLEVPEALTIGVSDVAVTFTDDIDRERTYALDGQKREYRLGASEFKASVAWSGTQLRKDVEGSFGFRLSETYFLSPDGLRLFVIIRVGPTGRNASPTGFNRVYDRVDAVRIDERASAR